jgi:hypothetical protein
VRFRFARDGDAGAGGGDGGVRVPLVVVAAIVKGTAFRDRRWGQRATRAEVGPVAVGRRPAAGVEGSAAGCRVDRVHSDGRFELAVDASAGGGGRAARECSYLGVVDEVRRRRNAAPRHMHNALSNAPGPHLSVHAQMIWPVQTPALVCGCQSPSARHANCM